MSVSMTFVFHLFNCLIKTGSELREKQKSPGARSGLYRRVRNCLDAHLGQIVCDKDGVVDWCIVLMEMPLTRISRLLASSNGTSS